MTRFLPYILKNLWRHRTRTFLTVSGSAVALFVFTYVGAVHEGLGQLTRAAHLDRTLVVFQANRYCPMTSRLPEHYAEQLAKLPGVQSATPIKVFMNNCRASLDVVIFHGIPVNKLRTARTINLTAGDWSTYERTANGALVGQTLAKRRNLRVGESFAVAGVGVQVAGIFQGTGQADENLVYTHLDFLQRSADKTSVGRVTQIEVLLQEGADVQEMCRGIDVVFRSGETPTDTRTKGVFQARSVGDLVELIGVARYLGWACVGMVLALVATTTVMAVQDRIREHAVLQTLGFTSQRIFGLVLTESLIVSFVGGLLGTGIAMTSLWWSGLAIGAEGVTIPFLPSTELALVGFGVTLLVGVFAGLVPAFQAARAEIVTSLRSV